MQPGNRTSVNGNAACIIIGYDATINFHHLYILRNRISNCDKTEIHATQMTSLENWSPIMLQSMWCTRLNQQPLFNADPAMALYFVAFVIIGEINLSFVLENLLSCVSNGPPS